MKKPLSLSAACASLPELWSPRVVAQANGQFLKVARVLGEFPWHAHQAEDELFLVLKGALTIGRSFEDGGPVTLAAGETFVVPRGVRHKTSALEETWVALFEPVSTAHTGDEVTALSRSLAEQLKPLPGE
jgi:mannose-6-phosphate isomerase-like protein (cupin superfamily)